MFGPSLRNILQGSALTWNHIAAFTQLLWCKLKYISEFKVSLFSLSVDMKRDGIDIETIWRQRRVEMYVNSYIGTSRSYHAFYTV